MIDGKLKYFTPIRVRLLKQLENKTKIKHSEQKFKI